MYNDFFGWIFSEVLLEWQSKTWFSGLSLSIKHFHWKLHRHFVPWIFFRSKHTSLGCDVLLSFSHFRVKCMRRQQNKAMVSIWHPALESYISWLDMHCYGICIIRLKITCWPILGWNDTHITYWFWNGSPPPCQRKTFSKKQLHFWSRRQAIFLGNNEALLEEDLDYAGTSLWVAGS